MLHLDAARISGSVCARPRGVALLGTIIVVGIAFGCTDKSPRHGGLVTKTVQTTLNEQIASRVPVVLRVKFEKFIGGQKFAWDEVSILGTLKNQTGRPFAGLLQIGHYGWEPGIPQGECTVYLEPYAEGDESRWKLLGGSAKDGVSHVVDGR